MIPLQKGGDLLYKCRLCGQEDRSGHCPSILDASTAILGHGRTPRDMGIIFKMQELHSCADGRYGVSDLIGFEPDK